jgi:hypothetical protein
MATSTRDVLKASKACCRRPCVHNRITMTVDGAVVQRDEPHELESTSTTHMGSMARSTCLLGDLAWIHAVRHD